MNIANNTLLSRLWGAGNIDQMAKTKSYSNFIVGCHLQSVHIENRGYIATDLW